MSLFTKPPPIPDLAPRLEKLERAMKALELDWEEYFERFRRLLARLSKRAADDERRANDAISGHVRAPGVPQDPRSTTTLGDRITNPLARRLLQSSVPNDNGGTE